MNKIKIDTMRNDFPMVDMPFDVEHGYSCVANVLQSALNQTQYGKGRERHSNNRPFLEQPILTIQRLQCSDIGVMYQAIKKLQESQRMEATAAIRERLGAIIYIAASILYLQEQNHEE